MSIVIGLGGLMTAGKDVVADHLVEKHGFVKLGMSDVLADALYILNPRIKIAGDSEIVKEAFIFDQLYFYSELVDTLGYVEVKTIPEVRSWLQRLGTEVGRNLIDENIWVEVAKKRIIRAEVFGTNDVVITGVRYRNELEMLKSLGHAVWVERPSVRRTASPGAHSSETSVSQHDFQYSIVNSGTIEELKVRVDDFLEFLRG